MATRAVILAGGTGTRLRPYTMVLPKPLMPIGEYPILEVVVRQLAFRGFERITMAVNHQANLIRAYFGDGSPWGVAIDYSIETKPLSTIAPLTLLEDLPEYFLLLNGDVLTDLDFRQFHDLHVRERRGFTIAASRRDYRVDFGILQTSDDHRLVGFSEKPVYQCLASMGVYMLRRDVVANLPSGVRYGFDDLMRDMLARQQTVHVYPFDGYWVDIGRPEDYERAIEEFAQLRQRFLPENTGP